MTNQSSSRSAAVIALVAIIVFVVGGYFLLIKLRVAAILVDVIRTVIVTVLSMF